MNPEPRTPTQTPLEPCTLNLEPLLLFWFGSVFGFTPTPALLQLPRPV